MDCRRWVGVGVGVGWLGIDVGLRLGIVTRNDNRSLVFVLGGGCLLTVIVVIIVGMRPLHPYLPSASRTPTALSHPHAEAASAKAMPAPARRGGGSKYNVLLVSLLA